MDENVTQYIKTKGLYKWQNTYTKINFKTQRNMITKQCQLMALFTRAPTTKYFEIYP